MNSELTAIRRHTLWSLISQDIKQYAFYSQAFQQQKLGLMRIASIIVNPAVFCVVVFRMSNFLKESKYDMMALLLCFLNRILHRVVIDPSCNIGPGLYIPHPSMIFMQGDAGRNLVLYAGAIVSPCDARPVGSSAFGERPSLGDDVVLGAASMILGPCHIGHRVRVGPGCLVTTSIENGMSVNRIQRIRNSVAYPSETSPSSFDAEPV